MRYFVAGEGMFLRTEGKGKGFIEPRNVASIGPRLTPRLAAGITAGLGAWGRAMHLSLLPFLDAGVGVMDKS